MGNVIDSFFSGFAKVVGNAFGYPLAFLAGKSCSSVCGSTWDFICYIEHFCVANLLKLAMVFLLLYIVLLFFYLLHKLGICECVSRSLCRMIWVCFASCLCSCEYFFTFLWVKLHSIKRRKRERIIDLEVFDKSSFEEDDDQDEAILCYNDFNYHKEIKNRSFLPRRKRDYKSAQLRKSLRPRSHSVIGAGISTRDLGYNGNRRNLIKLGDHRDHHYASGDRAIRVIRTSKFVQKGTIHKGRVHRRRR